MADLKSVDLRVAEERVFVFMAERIARDFAARMLKAVGMRTMREIVRRNNTIEYAKGACATHDFIDANMVMAAAMEQALGFKRDTLPLDGGLIPLWDAAWNLAVDKDFFIEPLRKFQY